MPSTNVFNELCVKTTLLRSMPNDVSRTVFRPMTSRSLISHHLAHLG